MSWPDEWEASRMVGDISAITLGGLSGANYGAVQCPICFALVLQPGRKHADWHTSQGDVLVLSDRAQAYLTQQRVRRLAEALERAKQATRMGLL